MAKHFLLSEAAEKKYRRTIFINKFTSIAACTAFMLLGGSMLYFTVILVGNILPPAFETYVSPVEDAPPTEKPKVKELTSKSTPANSSVAPSVIVAASAAAVAMAEVEIPNADVVLGRGLEIDLGLGDGIGANMGEAGGALGSGSAGGSTLEGTFYDLKLSRNGANLGYEFNEKGGLAGIGATKVNRFLGEFITGNWNPAMLKKYYQSPTKLYASNVWIPGMFATYAPKAFKADKKVKPSGWIVIYRGKVRAPKTGRFRFAGIGDDLLAVRFNKKLVLESGWGVPSLYTQGMSDAEVNRMGRLALDKNYQQNISSYKGHKDYVKYQAKGLVHLNNTHGGMTGGTIFHVEEGKEYPIEILLCEVGGAGMFYMLLMEDMDAPQTKDGAKLFDLFRTNFSMPDMAKVNEELKAAGEPTQPIVMPDYSEDSPIWPVVP